MPSNARKQFDQNPQDIEQLRKIHEEKAGQRPGRNYEVDVINRAGMIFITACWETNSYESAERPLCSFIISCVAVFL